MTSPGNSLQPHFYCSVWYLLVLAALVLLSGCDRLVVTPGATPLPTEYLPTVIAMTAQAAQPVETIAPQENAVNLTSSPTPRPSATPTARPSRTTSPTPQVSPTPGGASATPTRVTPTPTQTATSPVPNADIEIRNLGALARVTTPLHIYTYLQPGAGGRVRVELLGEDNRLLAREIRVVDLVPVGAWAVMTMDLDFEIAATAEAGRLVISVDDEVGRTVALNSVPLILLSVGDADITPPRDVLQPIIIHEPTKKTLIQGGVVRVSGLARMHGDQPLRVRLVAADGREVGMRLASVSEPVLDGYGEFAIEVSYSVDEPMPVLLQVTEGDNGINDIIHLSSIEVILSP